MVKLNGYNERERVENPSTEANKTNKELTRKANEECNNVKEFTRKKLEEFQSRIKRSSLKCEHEPERIEPERIDPEPKMKKPKMIYIEPERIDPEHYLKYPDMGFQMNKYIERAEKADSTCKVVSMDEAIRIDFSNNPKKEEVIFTYRLGGSVATGLVFKMKDGSEKAILSHNRPSNIQKGFDDIKKLASDIKPKDIKESKVFILAPGGWEKNNEGKYELSIKKTYKYFINLLEINGKIIAGSNTEIKEIPYSEYIQLDKKNQGTFRIVKRPDGKIKFIVEDYYPQGDVFDNKKNKK